MVFVVCDVRVTIINIHDILHNFPAVVSAFAISHNPRWMFDLSKLGYCITFWAEHFIFRRRGGLLGGYDMQAYDSSTLWFFAPLSQSVYLVAQFII